jgi:hypothetical protein
MSTLIAKEDDVNPNFIKPKRKVVKDSLPLCSWRLDRLKKAYTRAHLSYSPLDWTASQLDFKENLNQELQRSYPEQVSTKLIRVIRVHFPPGVNLYEDSEGNNIDPSVRSALVYTVTVSVRDPNSAKLGTDRVIQDEALQGAGKQSYTVGRYACPIPEYSFDRQGNITDSRIDYWSWRYYIKDDPKEIERLFKEFNETNDLSVAIAQARGSAFVGDVTYSVPNLQEFIHSDIMDLVNANSKNLLGVREGGVRNYKKFKELEAKVLETGNASQSDFDTLTKEDILNLIEKKKEAKKGNAVSRTRSTR